MGPEGEIKSLENELRHLTKDKTEASTRAGLRHDFSLDMPAVVLASLVDASAR